MTDHNPIERLGTALSEAYRRGALVLPDVDLGCVRSMEDAEIAQAAALAEYGDEPLGHALCATTPWTARLLGSDGPICGPILVDRLVSSGSSLRLGPAVIGIGAQLAFVFGHAPPRGASLLAVLDAVASCQLGLQVLGRRIPHRAPLDRQSGWADFGLTEAHVQGPSVPGWRDRLRADVKIDVTLDGHPCATGSLGIGAAAALAPLGWLVDWLHARDRDVEPGCVVTTGSLTGLLQVCPGQVVKAGFGDLGAVTVALT